MKLLITEAEIDVRTKEIAGEIIEKYQDADPVFIPLLSGGAPFASDLMEAITELEPSFHPETRYMATSTYSGTERKETKITLDATEEMVKNRTVVLIDDLMDTGQTAEVVFSRLRGLGAHAIKLVVLVQKEKERTDSVPKADIYGFPAPDKWLIGKGMNDDGNNEEAGRWLKDIWVVESGLDAA